MTSLFLGLLFRLIKYNIKPSGQGQNHVCRHSVSVITFKYKEITERPQFGCTLGIYKERADGEEKAGFTQEKEQERGDLMTGTERDSTMRQDAVINHKAIQTAYLFCMFVWVKAPEQAERAQLYY